MSEADTATQKIAAAFAPASQFTPEPLSPPQVLPDGPYAPPPILVNAEPNAAQIQAALRQMIAALGVLLGALGATGSATNSHLVNTLMLMSGPAAFAIAVLLGQLATRSVHQKLAITAAAAPDTVAQIK